MGQGMDTSVGLYTKIARQVRQARQAIQSIEFTGKLSSGLAQQRAFTLKRKDDCEF